MAMDVIYQPQLYQSPNVGTNLNFTTNYPQDLQNGGHSPTLWEVKTFVRE